MHTSFLSLFGAALLPLYFLLTIAIGWVARRHRITAGDYLNASRSLPLWIVAAAFLSANCGALEIMGLSAMAAEYGVQAFHFYWIGAIPGLVFVGLWMIPVYMRSGVRSVPEYLEMRYSPNLRLLNACATALSTLMLAGISLYAMAQVLIVVVGLRFWTSVFLSAGVVLLYALLGGVRATLYNEVFQLAVMLAGLVPLLCRIRFWVHLPAGSGGIQQHLWEKLPVASTAAPMDLAGVILGLGFVLSFSYWGTDFVQIQRALASRSPAHARQVPLWAGFGKILFSMLVILPGLAASHFLAVPGHGLRFDQVMPLMMRSFYGPTWLGVGLTALVASLMSGLASNISAFAAVWTQDIYRTRLRPGRSESHYLRMGYTALCAGTGISISLSSLSFHFGNLMENVQLIFSVLGAPFWAIFLLGMVSRRTTGQGAFAGFLGGALAGLLHQIALLRHWVTYGSIMTADFHVAILAFSVSLTIGILVSAWERPRPAGPSDGSSSLLVFHWPEAWRGERVGTLLVLAAALLTLCAVLNVLWR